jgi:hypothetical protein
MFRTSGRLIAKSLIKEGQNEWGKWQLVQFIVQKQHNRQKIKIVFVAFGKVARIVQDMPLKEKIDIKFFPNCKEHNGKFYTELKAEEVDKYVSRKRIYETMKDGAEPLSEEEYTSSQDNQLFETE